MAFDQEQRGIAGGAIAAALFSTLAMVLAIFTQILSSDGGWDSRVHILAIALIAPLLAMVHAIGAVANHRFGEPLDRNAAAAETSTAHVAILQAILRNTHEQALVAALVYMIAVIILPADLLDAILYCSILFLMGRLAFTYGYARGAVGRAFGFGLTFYPSVMLGLLTAGSALL